MKDFLLDMGVSLTLVVAGFAGGVMALVTEKKITLSKALTLIAAGGITAGYMTPIVCNYLNLTNPQLQAGVAFGIGTSALGILAGIRTLAKSRLKSLSVSDNS